MNARKSERVLRSACKENGFKLTPQRLEIYRKLSTCNDHPSAETLYNRAIKDFPYISLETVYRTLNKLEDMKLVSRIHTMSKQARFDANMSLHHHMICKVCESIEDIIVNDQDISQLITDRNCWGKVDTVDVVFTGVCQKCLEMQDKKTN